MDYKQVASAIVQGIGGESNIAGLTHCATRLRFTLRDDGAAQEDVVKGIKGVLGVARSGGQFQVIIGNEVPKVFASIQEITTIGDSGAQEAPAQKVKISERIFDFIASIFTPVLPAIIGAGLVKSVLALAVLLGMDAQSNTYYFLNIIGDAPLYFLPMMLAVTASKKLGCNSYMAVAITGALLHPNYTALITDAFSLHFSSMFGLPVTLASYNSSVIPVILMVILLKYVDLLLDRIIPKMVKFFFKPLLTLIIVASGTFLVLGPIGFVVGIGISTGLNMLSTYVGWLVPTIIGAIAPLMVTAGMHYGLVPFMLQSLSAQGFEQISGPGSLPSNIAQGAASLAVACRTKQSELKQTAFTTGVTALLGVTEPALFSVTLKFKKVLICVMTGGACGGLYAGLMGVKCFSFCSPGLLSMVAFVGPNGWNNFINACISMIIGFVVTFVLVWVWGYRDAVEETPAVQEKPEAPKDVPVFRQEEVVCLPASGRVVPLAQVPDPTFAEEILGKGAAVIPEDGKFYAPVDGEITNLTDTKHALGITSTGGLELLIHIGLETVALNGKGFTLHVEEGQKIRKGDLLVECDLAYVKAQGCEIITPVIVTNADAYEAITPLCDGQQEVGIPLLAVK
ncbi:MAG TPA: beta-glucoside-specific PTS transporter subunit IIABC [Candidatus Agathobaculum merdipullorum]|nr:beta-glucoside-specific PTS transporter subunit IIABC [Candidatus Agathobaculum merdipullorum]